MKNGIPEGVEITKNNIIEIAFFGNEAFMSQNSETILKVLKDINE